MVYRSNIKIMPGVKPVFDNGHAGLINGQYSTPGKQSPNWDKGILYEGMANRWIVNATMQLCDMAKIPYYHVSPELTDVPLWQRSSRANEIYKFDKSIYLLSNHNNAGGGKGSEIFTSKGETMSDPIAEEFLIDIEKYMSQVMRYDYTDGDRDKEADYSVLVKTDCPAILVEWEFMDHKEGYNKLWDPAFILKCAQTQFCTIERLYRKSLAV